MAAKKGMRPQERTVTSVDPTEINQDFIKLPSELATANTRYANAHGALLQAKKALKSIEAAKYLQFRETGVDGKRPTEKHIEAMIRTDDEYLNIYDAMIDADIERLKAYGIVDALRVKRDALVSIGATNRVEFQGDPSIRTKYDGAPVEEMFRGDPVPSAGIVYTGDEDFEVEID